MKTKILFLLLLVSLTSCQDFLDENPETFKTPQNFYKNEDQISEAVAAIYNTNRGLMNGPHWRFGENRSDNTSFQYNPSDRGGLPNEQVDQFLMLSSNPNLSSYWNTAYSGISRANFVLKNIESVDFTTPKNKGIRRGETLFLRSWFYFNLAELYGDVPFVTSAGNSPDQIFTDEFLERQPVSQVYDSILTDIDKSIQLLPPPDEIESGRATKGAALMLKAKVLMVRHEFGQAIPLLHQMEGLGYALQSDYASIFAPDNKNNSESVFEIQYSFALGQASNFVSRFVPYNSGNDILGTSGPAGSRAGQNQPTQDLIDLYDHNDARFKHNISFYDTGNKVEPWMSKFDYGFVEQGLQDVDFPMFRYADARLMLAECLAQTGKYNEGIAIINNEIRPRTGLEEPVTASSKEEALKKIAIERRLELAFENHRWFDLLRTGRAVEVMTAQGMKQKEEKESVPDEAYTNIRTLLGIPLNQVEEFGFEQNSGW